MLLLSRLKAGLFFVTLWMLSPSVFAEYRLNLRPGASAISQEVYFLHMTIFWICVAIGIGVFSVMFYAMFRHRKSLGAVPAQFHESTPVEIIWTLIPFLILIAMAIPASKVLIDMTDTGDSDVTIKVTGYQWKWQYEYMDEDIKFFSNLSTPQDQIHNRAPKGEHYLLEVDNRLVIPANQKIRFLITSSDVIHSWYVPAFSIKKDAIPGFINEVWTNAKEPGIYRGQCAELCGANHGFMPIVVEVKEPKDYAIWLEETKAKLHASK